MAIRRSNSRRRSSPPRSRTTSRTKARLCRVPRQPKSNRRLIRATEALRGGSRRSSPARAEQPRSMPRNASSISPQRRSSVLKSGWSEKTSANRLKSARSSACAMMLSTCVSWGDFNLSALCLALAVYGEPHACSRGARTRTRDITSESGRPASLPGPSAARSRRAHVSASRPRALSPRRRPASPAD